MERRLIVPVLLFALGAGVVITLGGIAGRVAVQRQTSPRASLPTAQATFPNPEPSASLSESTDAVRWKPPTSGPTPVPYQVAGDSMAPTLLSGDRCLVDEIQRAPPGAPSDRQQANQAAQTRTPFRPGDIVTIDYLADQHIKRVAAVEGDVVDSVGGRLRVNGVRLEDWIGKSLLSQGRSSPNMLLQDAVAKTTAISPQYAPLPPALVRLQPRSGRWDALPDGWWMYQYRNPYQSGRVTLLNDDYPLNKQQHRQLYPVDRLAIQLDASELPTESGEVISDVEVAMLAGEQQWRLQLDADGWASNQLPAASDLLPQALVDAMQSHQSQIAIRFPLGFKQAASQAEPIPSQFPFVSLFRKIHYRDDRPSLDYPLTIHAGQVFVVGDNVPVSVDSRTWGPLPIENVTGKLRLLMRQGSASEKQPLKP